MIVLDYQDRRPLYEQIVEKFRHLILNGALKPCGSDSADTMEEGSDTGRSVLWKRYVSYRGSNDCSQYGAGHEPVIYR